MTPFLSFFIILLVGVTFSQLFTRMRIPWVVTLILGGIIIGPSGLGLFEPDRTIDFLAQIGLVFLMFMAGLESRISSTEGLKNVKRRLVITATFIGLVPAIAGTAVTLMFGYEWQSAILVGIIFMSSAIALLIPQLQSQKIIGSELGKILVSAAVAVDALSLVLLSVFLQLVKGTFSPDILLLYVLIAIFVGAAMKIIPKMHWIAFAQEYPEEQDLFEKELRFTILILIGFVALFELVGLHSIIAAFFAGLVLSGVLKSQITKAKLHAISYGFLVPVFFVVIGASTDISVFFREGGAVLLASSIIAGLVLSKLLGGWIAGRLDGFNNKESAFLGIASTPQLSTALAVAFLGVGEGLLDQDLLASVVALAVVTATIAPIVTSILGRNMTSQQVTIKEAFDPKDKKKYPEPAA